MKNIGEEVIKLTNEALVKHDQKSLDDAKVKVLKSLIVDLSSKNLHENSVYKLLCKRPRVAFGQAIGQALVLIPALIFQSQDTSSSCKTS